MPPPHTRYSIDDIDDDILLLNRKLMVFVGSRRDIMSVSMTKSEGVTVMTMNSDPGSAWPPLCQILKALCYSPVCCNVSQKLRSVLGTSHSALGVSLHLVYTSHPALVVSLHLPLSSGG